MGIFKSDSAQHNRTVTWVSVWNGAKYTQSAGSPVSTFEVSSVQRRVYMYIYTCIYSICGHVLFRPLRSHQCSAECICIYIHVYTQSADMYCFALWGLISAAQSVYVYIYMYILNLRTCTVSPFEVSSVQRRVYMYIYTCIYSICGHVLFRPLRSHHCSSEKDFETELLYTRVLKLKWASYA